MKFRSALLLGGVVLITAIPVCADSVFYSASPNEPSNSESSAPTIGISHTKFITLATAQSISEPLPMDTPAWALAIAAPGIAEDPAQRATSSAETRIFAPALADPQNDARPSDPAPALLSVNGFQPAGASASSGPATSLVLDALIPAEFNSSESAFSDFSTEGSRFGFFGNDPDHDRDGKGKKTKKQDGLPVNVPEPGALPLLTLGLLAVGIIAARNRDLTNSA